MRRLTGLQKHQRDAVIAQLGRQLVGVDQLHTALAQFLAVVRIFKAQCAQAMFRVIYAMTVEMQHMEGFVLIAGGLQCLFQGAEGGWGEHGQRHQIAQGLHGLHQGQGAGAMVDITHPFFFRARAEQQDADR